MLGWTPKVALEDGLRAQMRWHEGRRDKIALVARAPGNAGPGSRNIR
jgi:hypothetical protein